MNAIRIYLAFALLGSLVSLVGALARINPLAVWGSFFVVLIAVVALAVSFHVEGAP